MTPSSTATPPLPPTLVLGLTSSPPREVLELLELEEVFPSRQEALRAGQVRFPRPRTWVGPSFSSWGEVPPLSPGEEARVV